jgi:hypothetical protein
VTLGIAWAAERSESRQRDPLKVREMSKMPQVDREIRVVIRESTIQNAPDSFETVGEM